MNKPAPTPLTGKALLQKVKELSHMPRRETAKLCGYYSTTKDSPDGTKDGRGREATYMVSVHKNGQIVIGSTYTKEMGLKPGDEFDIKLGYKHIHLIQVENGKDAGGDEEE